MSDTEGARSSARSTEATWRSRLWHSRISRKMTSYALLCGLLFTLAIAALFVFREYDNVKRRKAADLEFLRSGYLQPIASSLYKMDTDQLRFEMESLLKLYSIVDARVEDELGGSYSLSVTRPGGRRGAVEELALVQDIGATPTRIGVLRVGVTEDLFYEGFLGAIGKMLLIAAAAGSLVTAAFLYVLDKMVIRHLLTIADFAGKRDLSTVATPLALRRRTLAPDELDVLVEALNAMLSRIETDRQERGKVEAALEDSERRRRLAQEAAQAGIWEWNLETNESVWSEELWALLGLTPGCCEPSFEAWLRKVHPEDRDRVARAARQAAAEGGELDVEWRTLPEEGPARWLMYRGRPIPGPGSTAGRYAGIVLDITGRKRAEEALRQSEHKFRSYIEGSPDGVFVVDQDGRYLEVNSAAAVLTGYREPELLRLSIPDLLPPESQGAAREHFQRVKDEGLARGEFLYLRKDGTRRWWSVDAVKLTDTRYLGFATDVSARKAAEEENARLQDQLLQAQKMESVGRLAGGVAHDYNNMLGVILGHAEIGMRRADAADPLHREFAEIRKAAERSADLTRQLLAFARKQTIAPQALELNGAVEGTLEILRRLIGGGVELEWRPQAGAGTVRVDPSQLDQVLTNLCINARDALSGAGTIRIETASVTLGQEQCAARPGCEPGDYAVLSVGDDGCGMDREVLERIFEPFFTTKKPGEGTGLGLATVYGIVRQNGGFVDVQSEPGRGTTIRVSLPRITAAAQPPRREEPGHRDQGGQEVVLLVEDEPALLDLNTELLRSLGYTVLAASTPAEAHRLAAEHAGEVRLLLTDVVMPGTNGVDLSRSLLAAQPGLRCLFTSGFTADIMAREGVLEEGVHFLQKPFSLKDLGAKVRAVLDGSPAPEAPPAP